MRTRLVSLIAAASLIGSAAAAAAPTAKPDDPTPASQQSAAPATAPAAAGVPADTPPRALPEVTVLAERLKLQQRVLDYVYGIAELNNNEGLARWNTPVCPQVTGLPREQGEFILERLSQIARDAQVPLAGEHCTANLFIFLTGQPKELLQVIDRRKHFVVFGDAMPLEVEAFIDTARPVKVWYSTGWNPPGTRAGAGPPSGVEIDGASGGYRFPTARGPDGGSHLLNGVVYGMYGVYVIADQSQLQGVSMSQFADYVAMVGLAQIKPVAHWHDARSILALFAGTPQAAPAAMSDWDRMFLKYLYSTDQQTKLQRSAIAGKMVREILH